MEINFSKDNLEYIERCCKQFGITPDEVVDEAIRLDRRSDMITADRLIKKELVDDKGFKAGIMHALVMDICNQILIEKKYWLDEEKYDNGDLVLCMGIDILNQDNKEDTK